MHQTQPSLDCPRYDRCSVNNCPLDTSYPNLFVDLNDAHQKCPMEKNVRIRISSQYPGLLKHGGLTTREASAKARYDALPPAVKADMANRGRDRLKLLRAYKQG